jgi:hypothetical protein
MPLKTPTSEAGWTAAGRSSATPMVWLCIGEVQLPGAHIRGQLDCTRVVFSNANGRTLAADLLPTGRCGVPRAASRQWLVITVGVRLSTWPRESLWGGKPGQDVGDL